MLKATDWAAAQGGEYNVGFLLKSHVQFRQVFPAFSQSNRSPVQFFFFMKSNCFKSEKIVTDM